MASIFLNNAALPPGGSWISKANYSHVRSWRWCAYLVMAYYLVGSMNIQKVRLAIKGFIWSAMMLRYTVEFKWCSVGIIPHTITPPPTAACSIDTIQDGSTDSCHLHQILSPSSACHSRNWDLSHQTMFSQSPIIQFRWSCVLCCLSFLFLADRIGTWGLESVKIQLKIQRAGANCFHRYVNLPNNCTNTYRMHMLLLK